MALSFPQIVLWTRRFHAAVAAGAVLFLLLQPPMAAAQAFSGPYAGVDVGRQHIIGGALVDGVDTLQQDDRFVTSLFGGLRAQLGGVVIGGDLGVGRVDGQLTLADPGRRLTVNYQNRSQWHWAATLGHTVGAATLVFGYVSEVTRSFDVAIERGGQAFTQRDEQGMLRFGVGVERKLRGPLHLRGTLGSSRADFGGRPTNIEINRRLEFSLGVLVQL